MTGSSESRGKISNCVERRRPIKILSLTPGKIFPDYWLRSPDWRRLRAMVGKIVQPLRMKMTGDVTISWILTIQMFRAY
jgi:hypothetical protein